MAIQMRRGALADLDPTKLLPGEFAISTTGEPMVCRKAGDVVKMLTDKDQADLEALLLQLTELKSSIDTLIVQKVGINDAEATLTEAYSGSKTQTLLNAKAAQTAVDILNQSLVNLNTGVISVSTNTTTTTQNVLIDATTKMIYVELYNTSAQSFNPVSIPIGLAKYRARTSGGQAFYINYNGAIVQFSIVLGSSGAYSINYACQNSAVLAGLGIAVWQLK